MFVPLELIVSVLPLASSAIALARRVGVERHRGAGRVGERDRAVFVDHELGAAGMVQQESAPCPPCRRTAAVWPPGRLAAAAWWAGSERRRPGTSASCLPERAGPDRPRRARPPRTPPRPGRPSRAPRTSPGRRGRRRAGRAAPSRSPRSPSTEGTRELQAGRASRGPVVDDEAPVLAVDTCAGPRRARSVIRTSLPHQSESAPGRPAPAPRRQVVAVGVAQQREALPVAVDGEPCG